MSQIRYSPESIQGIVAEMVFCTRTSRYALCRERELERRRLERECEFRGESEQVERWQPGVLPQLLFFSCLFGGSFAY